MSTKHLPKAVFCLLDRVWPWRDVQYAEPGGVLRHDDDPVTSRYERKQKYRSRAFNFAEMRTLVDEGVLTALADDGDTIDVDWQEESALIFFLAEVAFAWRKYQKRVADYRERRANAAKLRARMAEEDKRYDAQIAKLSRNVSHFMKWPN